MTTPLPGCKCDNCKRWVNEPVPASISLEEAQRRNQAYEAHRHAWRVEHPNASVEVDTKVFK